MKPRYPVYVISKGRADVCYTAQFLRRDGVPFRLVVEPQEAEEYARHGATEDELLVTPFSNLGLGSIPARNFCWEHSLESGAERHWILDDNMKGTYRRWKAQKIPCDSGLAFHTCETFVDRYENVGIGGMNYYMFIPNGRKIAPFYVNHHVYSCLLIWNALPFRWRGRYNEDTDLCLQVLSTGDWCTVLFNAFMVYKMVTMSMKGGNATELYKGDGRLKMARSLERAWPGVVETRRRFQRPQHHVKGTWRYFDHHLRRKPDVDFNALAVKEDEIALVQTGPVESPRIREMVSQRVVDLTPGTSETTGR